MEKIEAPELDRTDVTGLKALPKPAPCVRAVVTATALLLGHWEEDVQEWKKLMMAVFGSFLDHIRKQVESLDINTMPLEVALGARSLMEGVTYNEVVDKTRGSAIMFVWNDRVIKAVLARFSAEEISNTKPKTKRNP